MPTPAAGVQRPSPLICLSHLRWDFVFQRPQHLMLRCARERPVYFIEEPIFEPGITARLDVDRSGPVAIAVPHLPASIGEAEAIAAQRSLIDAFIVSEGLDDYLLWYYTPMALAFTDHLTPAATIYDCMDELSAFRGAPPALTEWEGDLLRRAGLVLTGGQSLYEAKRHQHPNIHPFPSSVDVTHFGQARRITIDPPDQAGIPHPRLGFFGVIDERMDLELVAQVAAARPDWHVVMLGPVVKIDPAMLPRLPNIHYLGGKKYDELPHYVAGWDVALMPFARNEATRYISPTKTPEYMAAGKPVVSTSIRDVVRPYGKKGLVRIADEAPQFVAACDAAIREDAAGRQTRADAFLRHTSWDGTWTRISQLIASIDVPTTTDDSASGMTCSTT
jgi:UDP-galactopyranose mutase